MKGARKGLLALVLVALLLLPPGGGAAALPAIMPLPGELGEAEEDSSTAEESQPDEVAESSAAESGGESSSPEESDAGEPDAWETPVPLPAEPGFVPPVFESTEENLFDVAYELLEGGAAIVYTFAGLKELLEEDNGVTTFHFGADIVATTTGGAIVHAAKTDVVFDGRDPVDPAVIHSYTEYGTSDFVNTIRMNIASTPRSMTARNMIIQGKNYFGPFSVLDGVRDITLHFDNVVYNGPQMIYNRYGTAHCADVDATIEYTGHSGAQEFAEATELRFYGSNRIQHEGTTRVFFFEVNDGVFAVEDGARLEMSTQRQDLSFFYSRPVTLSVGENARLQATMPGRFNESNIASLRVAPGGVFDVHCTGVPAEAIVNIVGDTTVAEGAAFRVVSDEGYSERVVVRQGGDVTTAKDAVYQVVAKNKAACALYLPLGATAQFVQPKSVLLYNANSHALRYDGKPGELIVAAQQVNYWLEPKAYELVSGFDNPPLYGWRKADGGDFTLSGTVSVGTTGNFTSLDTNYEEGDEPGVAPDSNSLNLSTARMLAFGWTFVEPDELFESSPDVSGWTDPLAGVRAVYEVEDDGEQGLVTLAPESVADAAGAFAIPLLDTIPQDTEVLVQASIDGLRAEALLAARESNLDVVVPEALRFPTTTLSSREQWILRQDPDWSIEVSDYRPPGSVWELWVRLEEPLAPVGRPELPALPEAVVFVDSEGTHTLRENANVPVARHTSGSVGEQLTLVWPAEQGILLRLRGGEGCAGVPYEAVLRWNIADVP